MTRGHQVGIGGSCSLSAWSAVPCFEEIQGREQPVEVLRFAGVDEVEIKGGDRGPLQNRRDAADDNVIYAPAGHSLQDGEEISFGRHAASGLTPQCSGALRAARPGSGTTSSG